MGASAGDLLVWVSGPGLAIAGAVFLSGVVLRLFEICALGRAPDLSAPRAVKPGSGLRTVWRRMLPPKGSGMLRRAPVTYVGGYVFHVGFLAVVVLAVPHIATFQDLAGIGWPGLPAPAIDALALVSIAALLAVLIGRLRDRVKRFLSDFPDYFAWTLTMLPLLTGAWAHHAFLLDYTLLLSLHILSAEVLLIALPFTRLAHAFTLFVARWYNGDISARKGVAS
jgi:nitrate reductase gamma subunit